MTVKITAIVCTHNQAQLLGKALQSLVRQTLAPGDYEILVIDNGSIDNTREIVRLYESGANLRYIYEPQLGLSKARNTGWQNARGEIVSYLDDDAIVCPEWLERILEAFQTVPEAGVIGGRINPIWEAPRPAWLSDTMMTALSVINWSEKPVFLNQEQCLVGTNISFPKRLLEEVGGFSSELGRKGKSLLSNEENLLILKITEKGFKDFYHPRILVEHLIPACRLKKNWFKRRYYWQGISDARLDYWNKKTTWMVKFFLVFGHCLRFIKNPELIFYLLLPSNHKNVWDVKIKAYHKLGYMRGILSLDLKAK